MMKKLRGLFGAQDMTQGNPLAVMMMFSLPLLIGNIAQLLYTTVDSIVVGQLISNEALSAVGASSPIQNLFFVFYMTVGTGISVVVSQYFGAKDKQQLSQSVGNAIIMAIVATLSITALGVPLSGVILRATKVDESIFPMAHSFLMIMFAGAIGVGFYNILSGILRGLGDSMFPLLVLIGTSLLNVALVLLFVGVFGWGVPGTAWATVTAQTVSALVCLWRLMRMKDVVVINREMLRPVKRMILHILRIGLPSGVQQAILTASYVFVQSLINGIVVFDATGAANKTIFVAAATAFSRVDAIAMLPSQAFSMGGSTYAGQNIGAGRMDRVKKGFTIISVCTLIMSAILFIGLYIFGGQLIQLFIKPGAEHSAQIIEIGIHITRIMVWTYIEMALLQPCSGVLRGAGDTLPVMWITIFCTVALRVPMAALWVNLGKSALNPGGNPDGIYWSMVICFGIAAAMSLGYYATGRWKKKAIVKAAATAE